MYNKSRNSYLAVCKADDVLDWYGASQIATCLESFDREYQEAWKKEMENIKPEHPEPDLVYEAYRDSVDDDFRNAAEMQGMLEDEIEERLENWSEEEMQNYTALWDEKNNMWK